MRRNNIKAYTVKELKEELEKLIENGMGDRIVLVPNDSPDFQGEYRTVREFATDDIGERCVYLEAGTDEEEEMFWEGWVGLYD